MQRNGNFAQLLAEQTSEACWYGKVAYYSPQPIIRGEIYDSAARHAQVLRGHGISPVGRGLLCLPESPELAKISLARGAIVLSLCDRFSRVVDVEELLFEVTEAGLADYQPVGAQAPVPAARTSNATRSPKAAFHRHAGVLPFGDVVCRYVLNPSPNGTGVCGASMYFAYGLVISFGLHWQRVVWRSSTCRQWL